MHDLLLLLLFETSEFECITDIVHRIMDVKQRDSVSEKHTKNKS